MADYEMTPNIEAEPQPMSDVDHWDKQIVWLPLSQLLHYERSEQERIRWAARNRELQDEIDKLKAGGQ